MHERRVIIGRLSWSHVLVLAGLLAAIAWFVWLGVFHGYYRPRFEERQFGLLYFASVLGFCGLAVASLGARLKALILRRGVGLEVLGDRLIYLSPQVRAVRLNDVREIRPGPTGLFVDVPGSLIVEMAAGWRWQVPTLGFTTPVPEMLSRLSAAGLRIGAPADEIRP